MHPAVQNVACVPMPDAALGEKMCAFVIPRRGATLALPELTAFLLTHEIAKFKLPERLELMSDFPVSTFGKVSKKALGEMVAQKLADESQAPQAA
jgi:2,3-dihydroxybenzoate-AMP ligase